VADILKNSLEVVVVVYAVYILSQISGRLSEIAFPRGSVTFLFGAAASTSRNTHRPARMCLLWM